MDGKTIQCINHNKGIRLIRMEAIQTKQDLQNAIAQLEQRQLLEKQSMQKHYQETYEHLKPVSLLKNAITDITDSGTFKKDMLKAALALALSYLVKKVVERYIVKSSTPLTTAIETIVQIVISGWLAKNRTILKNVVLYFLKTMLKHQENSLLLSAGSEQ